MKALNFKKFISLILILALLLSFSACNHHFTYEGLKVAENENMGEEYHMSNEANYKPVVKSGLYELLLDETNCAVALKDTTDTVWYSLPVASNSLGSMLSMEVTEGSKLFNLNSQDNSVAFKTATIEKDTNGIVISYIFQDKLEEPNISLPISLEFTLEDGVLKAFVDMSKVDTSKYTILSLDILPTFGAVSEPKSGDFIVIPDGCGALIDLEKAESATYTLDTYGAIEDLDDGTDTNFPAIFAAFGLKNGNNAYAGIVTSGDTISKIKATTDSLDTVCASFSYPSDEKLEVTYKFIAGSAATYASLASMCREQFVRDGILSTRSVSSEGNFPINITLEGSAKTDFENAEDIVSVLKAKGINSLNLRIDNAIKNLKINSRLGGDEKLKSLQSYLASQGFGFYMTMNLDTAMKGSVSKFQNKIASFINKNKDKEIEGYCLTNIGETLDATNSSTREEMKKAASAQAIALSTNKYLMVEHGNIYSLKNADIVSNLPITTTYSTSDSYIAVPFAQMVFHGIMEYTGPYLNQTENYQEMLLKCLEFGTIPSFYLTFDDEKDYYYEEWDEDALDVYKMFKDPMSTLRNAKMTDHKKIKDGLYVTEYNNETFIYVNYTDEDIDYNGLTIKAQYFLRVN